MQHAPHSKGGVAPSMPAPGAPAVQDHAVTPRALGGDAGSDRARTLFRRYATAWAPAVLALIVIEIVTRPIDDTTAMLTLVALTAGSGAATLFAAYALSRDIPGRWPFVAIAVIDVAAIAVALMSAAGNDTAIFLPFLGGLLMVGLLDGRELRTGFMFQWFVGMIGATLAYAVGPLSATHGDPLIVSLAAAGTLTFVGYTLLWWVRSRLDRAIAGARQAEAEARTSAGAMEALIRSTPVSTIGFDLAGRIRSWNPAAETVFGWRSDEVMGAEPDLLAPTAADDGPSVLVARVLAGETVEGVRTQWQTRDGAMVDVGLHAALLLEADRTPVGAVIQAIDETEREALRTRVTEVQRLEAVGQLAGGIAHDFNNILTAISGYAQLLESALPEDDPARADAREIERSAARGADLVRQLLAFGRRQPVRPVVLDVNELVDGLQPMLERLIGTHARIHVQPDPGLPAVLADPGQLGQVVVNLVVNARDATPPGGDITIRTSALTGEDGAPRARLSVIDTGAGMDQATQARVFEPFFTTKAAGRGTGLGLATVYGIVTAHGGSVSLVSAPGRGTAFHVDLPAAASATAEPLRPTAPKPSARPSGSGTVFVIDDEEAVRRLVVRALAAAGYRTLEAGDMWTALQVAGREEGAIDLVLSDVVMPDCRGPDLVQRVRRFHPEARILYMTGYAAEGLGGPDTTDIDGPVLDKPFTIADLTNEVAAILGDR